MRLIQPLIALVLVSGLAACVTAPDPAVVAAQQETQVSAYLSRALTEPMPQLYVAARKGKAEDQLVFALALEAGRDNSAQVPPDVRATVDAYVTASLDAVHTRALPVPSAPSAEQTSLWADQTMNRLMLCTPCDVTLVGFMSTMDISFSDAVGTYAEATSGDYWLSQAQAAQSPSTTAVYVPPVRAGGSGSTMLVNVPTHPLIPPAVVADALQCTGALNRAVKLDAARRYLAQPAVIAIRPDLTQALLDRIASRGEYPQACPAGQFERLKALDRAARPELDGLVIAALQRDLTDPRYIQQDAPE